MSKNFTNIIIYISNCTVKSYGLNNRIRKSTRLAGIFTLILLFSQTILAQNLYDAGNSFRYGRFLFETKQYKKAAEEFERVLFMNPENDTVQYQLIRSYLLGKQFSMVTSRTDSLFRDSDLIPRDFAIDYSRALILEELNFNASRFINSNRNLTESDRYYLNMNNQLLGYEWDKAKLSYDEMVKRNLAIDKSYAELFNQMNSAHYKSTGLALGLSTVVPGLGKVYTGNWKDGLVSFVFVAGSAIQAIRGHHEYGKNSAFFIVYTSLATTFYIGNLYGTAKAAKKHNDKIRKQLHAKMESAFSDTF